MFEEKVKRLEELVPYAKFQFNTEPLGTWDLHIYLDSALFHRTLSVPTFVSADEANDWLDKEIKTREAHLPPNGYQVYCFVDGDVVLGWKDHHIEVPEKE